MGAPLGVERGIPRLYQPQSPGQLEGSGNRAMAENRRMRSEIQARLRELSGRRLDELSDTEIVEFQGLRKQQQRLMEDESRIKN